MVKTVGGPLGASSQFTCRGQRPASSAQMPQQPWLNWFFSVSIHYRLPRSDQVVTTAHWDLLNGLSNGHPSPDSALHPHTQLVQSADNCRVILSKPNQKAWCDSSAWEYWMDFHFHNMLWEALEWPSMYNTYAKDLKEPGRVLNCQKGPNSSKTGNPGR